MFNTTEESEGPGGYISFPREVTITAGVCAVLFVILGTLGNSITILALSKDPKLSSRPTTWFVINLSVSELVFSAICLPNEAATNLSNFHWLEGDLTCKLVTSMSYATKATSLISLAAITVNRYILTLHYSSYSRIFTKAKSLLIILIIWTFCFGMQLLPLFEIWGKFGREGQLCTVIKNKGSSPGLVVYIFFYVIPELSIIYCYTRIFIHARSSRLKALGGDTALSKRKAEDQNQLTKMIFLIVFCFQVCYIPRAVVQIFDPKVTYPTVRMLASILIWCPSWVNTAVYVLTNKQYRRAYERLFSLAPPEERSTRGVSMAGQMGITSESFSQPGGN